MDALLYRKEHSLFAHQCELITAMELYIEMETFDYKSQTKRISYERETSSDTYMCTVNINICTE